MKGKFFVIDGIDGSGKTTQTRMLKAFCDSRKIPCETLHYPDYEGPIGTLIKEYLHNRHNLSPEMQFLLYASDMVKDKEKINSWLQAGRCVIADRFFTTTMAYQCMARGFPLEKAISFAGLFGMPKPDRIIYLRISPESSLERKKKQKSTLDRNEVDIGFQKRLSEVFEGMVERGVFGSWFVLDGEKSIEQVFEDVKRALRIK